MRARFPLITAGAVAVLALLLPVAPAKGAGGPMVGTDAGWSGVTNPNNDSRYVAVLGVHGSMVARIAKRGGKIEAMTRLPRPLTFPSVALDQSATGLSADGGTLVLAIPSYGYAKRSVFGILGAKSLKLRKIVKLPGYLTLDGVSADGRHLYLVKYAGRSFSANGYELRSFDLRTNRLDPDPIVDPRNPGEKMTGLPLTRIASRDGSWDYTLYDGEERFIHALDTRSGRAFCVDLDGLAGIPVNRLRLDLEAGGKSLTVAGPEGALAEIDTKTLAVSQPGGSSGVANTVAVLLIAAAAACSLVLAIAIRRALRRRRELAPG